MGTYINIGSAGFQSARNSEYVDKSGLIAVVNATLNTERRFTCVTRSRRFGKSMAARMLNAYYDQSCDSRNLFADLEIVKDSSFEEHLNKYPVIFLDMTAFVTRFHDEKIVDQIENELIADIKDAYPDVSINGSGNLMDCLINIVSATQQPVIFIIDEWDAICREFKPESAAMDRYVNWLRRMFKDVNASRVFAGVYMTGILPIKKYKTESALNNFTEYSMVKPARMAGYFGFTKEETKVLAQKHGMDFDELEKWYDGYQIGDQLSIFNPNSVMRALYSGYCTNYWGCTAAYDTIHAYLSDGDKGLKKAMELLVKGEIYSVDLYDASRDIRSMSSISEILSVLVHLGFLTYDKNKKCCFIPNTDVLSISDCMLKDYTKHNIPSFGINSIY